MPWPLPSDFDEAAENLVHSMSDEELRAGRAAVDDQGLPMVWSGGFAQVYKVHCPATGHTWALKCFTKEIRGQGDRYARIADRLKRAQLPFTVPFEYLPRGARVRGEWFPALKMEWIEGQTLNRFVEGHLAKPTMLKQLLDWWPKLAARVREKGIAHADLQHGNILLVPMADNKLAIKLIDYDGMYVPELFGTRSGELGHPCYQHPQRLRQGIYSADVDRFSHLVIYTAVHCLKSGGQDLWRQFNNDDNLLFRETDFREPAASTVFQSLWNRGDEPSRAMVGRLVLACGQRLEEVPWLDELVVKGRVRALTGKEESQVAKMLAVGKATVALAPPLPRAASGTVGEGRGEGGGAAPIAEPPTPPVETSEPATTDTRPATAEGTVPATPSPGSRVRAAGKWLWGGLAAAGRPLDGFFRRLVGEENDLLRYALWAVLPVLLLGAVWLAASTLWHTPITQKAPIAPTAELKLRAIASQTVEAGKPLTVTVTPENADTWKGKLRYSLAGQAPPGTSIDPTGRFTWTPTKDQKPGKYDVAVSAEGPHGQKAQTTLAITVTVPLRMVAMAPQTVEAGKPLALAISVEEPQQWEGKVRFRLGAGRPPGANIDPQTGNLTWTPSPEQAPGKYDLAVSVETSDGRHDETSIAVTVTAPVPLKLKPIAAQSIEAGKPLSVAISVDDAERWHGKVQFGLGADAPSGASIDPQTGRFTWTPMEGQKPGKYDITVAVQGPEGRRAETTFSITVTPPSSSGQKELAVDLGNGVKLELVLIPAGEFMMGSPDSDKGVSGGEKPQHRVRITKPFYLGKYKVTQEQWEAVMGNNPSTFQGPKNPVEEASWDDCQEFMKKLNEKSHRPHPGPLPEGEGEFRLPTEAQWEYACRAGSKTTYCFGDDESELGEYAWYDKNSGNKTHPVGEKKPNAWGLYDMHGNVEEWCQDWYKWDYYKESPMDDPTGAATGSIRVYRGAGWPSPARFCRSAFRFIIGPGYRRRGLRASRAVGE